MLEPLVKNSVNTVFSQGCQEALTGPIERADEETVEKHLSALKNAANPLWDSAYRSVGALVTELAKEKNPATDYREIEHLLKESK